MIGCGITRSLCSGTPCSASASRPLWECATTRPKRWYSVSQTRALPAVRRWAWSWAVYTSGARERSSQRSSSGIDSHCTCTTSARRSASPAMPNGCSATFTGTRSRERPNSRADSG